MRTINSFFYYAMMVVVMMISTVSMVSCGDDDEDAVEEMAIVSATAPYHFEVSNDLLEVADITITYYENNEEKTEKMTSTTWEKKATNKVPGKIGFSVAFAMKSGYTPTRDTYVLSYGCEDVMIVALNYSNGTNTGEPVDVEKEYVEVPKENLEKFLSLASFRLVYSVSANGKLTKN